MTNSSCFGDKGSCIVLTMSDQNVPSRKDMIEMLEEMSKSLDRIPEHAMITPVNHYDWQSVLLLLVAYLKSLESCLPDQTPSSDESLK